MKLILAPAVLSCLSFLQACAAGPIYDENTFSCNSLSGELYPEAESIVSSFCDDIKIALEAQLGSSLNTANAGTAAWDIDIELASHSANVDIKFGENLKTESLQIDIMDAELKDVSLTPYAKDVAKLAESMRASKIKD